jgi:hypothetical protein
MPKLKRSALHCDQTMRCLKEAATSSVLSARIYELFVPFLASAWESQGLRILIKGVRLIAKPKSAIVQRQKSLRLENINDFCYNFTH